jgi:hypothetical protein
VAFVVSSASVDRGLSSRVGIPTGQVHRPVRALGGWRPSVTIARQRFAVTPRNDGGQGLPSRGPLRGRSFRCDPNAQQTRLRTPIRFESELWVRCWRYRLSWEARKPQNRKADDFTAPTVATDCVSILPHKVDEFKVVRLKFWQA